MAVHIGHFANTPVRPLMERICASKRHNNKSCSVAHRGGTHSLGPEWGNLSRYTEGQRRR